MEIWKLMAGIGLAIAVALLTACAHAPPAYPCGDPRATSWCSAGPAVAVPAPIICNEVGAGVSVCL